MCDVVPVKVGRFRLPASFFLCTRLSFHMTGLAQAVAVKKGGERAEIRVFSNTSRFLKPFFAQGYKDVKCRKKQLRKIKELFIFMT